GRAGEARPPPPPPPPRAGRSRHQTAGQASGALAARDDLEVLGKAFRVRADHHPTLALPSYADRLPDLAPAGAAPPRCGLGHLRPKSFFRKPPVSVASGSGAAADSSARAASFSGFSSTTFRNMLTARLRRPPAL